MDMDQAKALYDSLLAKLEDDMKDASLRDKLGLLKHLADQGVKIENVIKKTEHKPLDLPDEAFAQEAVRDL